MFNFFKKKPSAQVAGEPHPQHRNFARMALPIMISSHRSKFLGVREDAQATAIVRDLWRTAAAKALAAKILTADQLISEDELEATVFHHESRLFILIEFPTVRTPGEAYLGLIVTGPELFDEQWASPEAREKVPARYFLLERSASGTPTVFEWRPSSTQDEELFDNRGSGPSSGNPMDFVETVFGLCGIQFDA